MLSKNMYIVQDFSVFPTKTCTLYHFNRTMYNWYASNPKSCTMYSKLTEILYTVRKLHRNCRTLYRKLPNLQHITVQCTQISVHFCTRSYFVQLFIFVRTNHWNSYEFVVQCTGIPSIWSHFLYIVQVFVVHFFLIPIWSFVRPSGYNHQWFMCTIRQWIGKRSARDPTNFEHLTRYYIAQK